MPRTPGRFPTRTFAQSTPVGTVAAPAVYFDGASGAVAIVCGGSDTLTGSDAGGGVLTVTGGATDAVAHAAVAAGSVTVTGTGADMYVPLVQRRVCVATACEARTSIAVTVMP